jgi:hypothetical protein
VEGLAPSENVSDRTLKIRQNLQRRNAKGPETLRHQPFVTCLVASWNGTTIVRGSIHLDRQPRREAHEIQDERTCRMLSSELETAGALPECAPQQNLGQRHLPSQPASLADRRAWTCQHRASPSTMLRMVPLPVPGRIAL